MSERWWMVETSKAAVGVRNTRRRLRASYRRQVAREVDAAKVQMAVELEIAKRCEADRAGRDIKAAQDELLRVSRELMRLKVEFGPVEYGYRFTLMARMSDTMARHGHEVRDIGGIVIRRLAAELCCKLTEIDFTRMKPDRFDPEPGPRAFSSPMPVWSLASSDKATP